MCHLFLLPAAAEPCAGAVEMDMLGGKTDSPIIQVDINGHKAGMYLSGDFDDIYINDKINLDLSAPLKQVLIISNGEDYNDAHLVMIERFKIGNMNVGAITAVASDYYPIDYIRDIPVVGVIGENIFKVVNVLIDYPNNKLYFLPHRNNDECSIKNMDNLKEKFHNADLVEDQRNLAMRLRINGTLRDLHIDTALSDTEIPIKWIKTNSKSTPAYNTMTIYDKDPKLGYIGSIKELCAKEFCEHDVKTLLLKGISYGSVGNAFFEGREVLFDYADGKIFFSDRKPDRRTAGKDLHFEKTRQARIRVSEMSE